MRVMHESWFMRVCRVEWGVLSDACYARTLVHARMHARMSEGALPHSRLRCPQARLHGVCVCVCRRPLPLPSPCSRCVMHAHVRQRAVCMYGACGIA